MSWLQASLTLFLIESGVVLARMPQMGDRDALPFFRPPMPVQSATILDTLLVAAKGQSLPYVTHPRRVTTSKAVPSAI